MFHICRWQSEIDYCPTYSEGQSVAVVKVAVYEHKKNKKQRKMTTWYFFLCLGETKNWQLGLVALVLRYESGTRLRSLKFHYHHVGRSQA
jgi:hypothetical protein